MTKFRGEDLRRAARELVSRYGLSGYTDKLEEMAGGAASDGPAPSAPFDPVADVAAFHWRFGLEYVGPPRELPQDLRDFRRTFLQEEVDEYWVHGQLPKYQEDKASYVERVAGQLDALVDLVYVALGTAYLQGFDFRAAWRRVHEANMKKVRSTRPASAERGGGYDVVKPPGWVAPDLCDLVDVRS